MKRLTALNLLLAVLIGLGCWQLHVRGQQHAAAAARVLSRTVEAAPAPVLALPEAPSAIRPADYIEVAQQLPFHPERHPEVYVEEPPPKPRPELPKYYGLLNFGGPPRVVLTVNDSAPQKSYQAGDEVGDFVLTAISADGLTFQWDDETIVAPFATIRGEARPAAPRAAGKAEAPKKAAPAAPKAIDTVQKKGPGGDITPTMKACIPGDDTPVGTIVGGYRKVVSPTPFGDGCRWESVR